jgi:hypothetical protein
MTTGISPALKRRTFISRGITISAVRVIISISGAARLSPLAELSTRFQLKLDRELQVFHPVAAELAA